MVFQLNQDQLLKLVPHEGLLNYGDRVVFLTDASDSVSVTMKAGRRGGKYGYSSEYAFYNYGCSLFGHVESVALINTPVEVDDHVFVVSDSSLLQGQEAVVRSVYSDGRIRVEALEGRDQWDSYRRTDTVSVWVKVGPAREPKPEVPASPEDMQLSEWWIERIKTIAAQAKKKHGMCSSIDAVVRELLEPVLVKWTTEPRTMGSDELSGWAVINPKGELYSWHLDSAEAEKLVTTKNKNLTV